MGSAWSDYYQYNYKYDTLTNTYTQLTNIPYNFYYGSAVAIGTDIYLLGGYGINKNYKYDTLTDTYTQLTNIPYNFQQGSAVAVGTNIYLFGSADYKQYAYNYNTLTNTYTKLTNIPYNFYSGSAVAVGTNIYLFGGGGNNQYAYKYNTITNTYTQLTNIPYGVSYSPAVVVGLYTYLLGSYESAYSKKVQVYVLESKTYEQDELVVICQGKYKIAGYEIELYSNSKDVVSAKYTFADAWYYTQNDGLITNIPTYYGNGTQWIKIKN